MRLMSAAAVCLALSSPLAASATDVVPPETVAVEAVIKAEMADRRIPGLQVVVVRGGRIVLNRSYGEANLQTPVPVTDETVFSINSITKAFAGVEVMRLVEQGKVSLDAPVATYLADLPEAWRTVTVRQALSHMSGIPNIISNATGRLVGDGTEEGAWTFVTTRPVDFAPGERFAYNQTNYALLQRIVEKFEGKPFTDVVAEKQFAVAGMAHSGFGDSRDVIPGKSQSYRYQRQGDAPAVLQNVYEEFPQMRRAASGLNSTATDMGNWVIALQQGRILRRESLATLWTQTSFKDGRKGEWALGWIVLDRPRHRAVGMTGGGRSAFYVYPQDDLAVVVLTNLAGGSPEDIIDDIASVYVPSIRDVGIPALRGELRKQGYGEAKAVFAALKKKNPAYAIAEDDLNNWAYRLLSNGQLDKATPIFELTVDLYPKSANAYDSLAEAYAAGGKRDLAIENYRRSLVLDPKNDNARKRLEKLGATPAP